MSLTVFRTALFSLMVYFLTENKAQHYASKLSVKFFWINKHRYTPESSRKSVVLLPVKNIKELRGNQAVYDALGSTDIDYTLGLNRTQDEALKPKLLLVMPGR